MPDAAKVCAGFCCVLVPPSVNVQAYDAMLPPDRGDYDRVAVVGAGVSGLTVAHDLVRIGYKVTVFEAYSEPRGSRKTAPSFRRRWISPIVPTSITFSSAAALSTSTWTG